MKMLDPVGPSVCDQCFDAYDDALIDFHVLGVWVVEEGQSYNPNYRIEIESPYEGFGAWLYFTN